MAAKNAPVGKPSTGYLILVLIVAWLGWVFDVFDTSLFFLAKSSIVKEFFGETVSKQSGAIYEGIILGCFYAGWAVGGLVFGILADRWGRVRTLIVTILLYSVFTALTYFCENWWQMAAIRFLTALGIGGEWAAGTALVSEVLPDKLRAMAATFLQTAAALGPILAGVANNLLVGYGWRPLFLVGALPALLTIVIRLGVKEPERWKRVVKDKAGSPLSSLKDLMATPERRRLAYVALAIAVVGILGASNMSFWLPNLIEEASPGLSKNLMQMRKGTGQMVMHIGTIFGVIVFPMLCNWIGRKKSFLIFMLISPFAVAGVYLTPLSYEQILLFAPIMSFFVLGLTAGFPLYLPELFATRYRATGLGFSYNTGRALLIPWPLMTGYLISIGGVGPGVVFTASIFFVGVVAVLFAPETKGKPLPE